MLVLQGVVVVMVVVVAAVVIPGAGGGVETVAAVVAVVMFGMVAVTPTAKFLRSCTSLQAAISVLDGIEGVVNCDCIGSWTCPNQAGNREVGMGTCPAKLGPAVSLLDQVLWSYK